MKNTKPLKPLKPKEIMFADLVIDGLTMAEAYKQAGYTANTDASASSCASRLIRRPHVQDYIQRQKIGVEQASLLTKQRLIGKLATIIERADDKKYPIAKAIDQMIQVMGWSGAQKIEVDAGPGIWEAINERQMKLAQSVNQDAITAQPTKALPMKGDDDDKED